MMNKNVFVSSLVIFLNLALCSCASDIKKANIPNTANPQEEIARLNTDLMTATTQNIDVLAASEFTDSAKWLAEAKKDLADKDKQEVIIEDLRTARGFLEKAYEVSASRSEKAPGLFQARQAALNAGAAKYAEISDDLKKLDSDVSSEARDLGRLDSEKISVLQERYTALEIRATILNRLGTTQALFNGLKKDGAARLATASYRKAELSLKNAESVISANVRNPESFSMALRSAQSDTALLNEVMKTIEQNKGLTETAALKMVSQKSQIENLNTDLSASHAESALSKTQMNAENNRLTKEIQDSEQNLNAANQNVQTQQALDNARSQFSSDEAEAYQVGKNLLIRLKKVNFASGRADLPGHSLELLAKVSAVAKSIHASEIKIEGHTDSVGSVNQNKLISEKRASAVASYFTSNGFKEVTSEGYGFQKPIATNKSKEGRAQNRRVDIVITPESSKTLE